MQEILAGLTSIVPCFALGRDLAGTSQLTDLVRIDGVEGESACQQEVHDNSQTKYVDGLGVVLAFVEFRGDKTWCPCIFLAAVEMFEVDLVGSQTEVNDLGDDDVSLGLYHDVAEFEVSMNQPHRMDVFDGFKQLLNNPAGFFLRNM